tara:strand:- start:512 stop:1705 length:1194 start_codon:yes stop_codon:yes gene_type:complete
VESHLGFIDEWGVVLSPVYFSFLLLTLAAILKNVGCRKEEVVGFCFVFFYYYFLFLLNSLFRIAPIYPDTLLFSTIIEDNYFPEGQSTGVKLFTWFTSPLRFIALYQIEIFVVVQMFLMVLATSLLWKAWCISQKYNNCDKDYFVCYILLLCTFPAFMLFVTIPLRDFLALLGVSFFVLGYIYVREGVKKGVLFVLLGTLICCVVRPAMAILSVVSLVLFFRRTMAKILFLLIGFAFAPFVFIVSTGYTFSPQFFSYVRNSRNERYAESEMVYGIVDWESYWDIFMDLPELLLQFLIAPIPVVREINYLAMKAHFLDAVFCIFVYVLAFIFYKRSKDFCLLFLLLASLFAIWEFYIGGAVRHRMPLVAILLPAASYSVCRIKRKLYGCMTRPEHSTT